MNKWKFGGMFAAGAVSGAFCMVALQAGLARGGGRPGGEVLVLPLVVLLVWVGWCLGHSAAEISRLDHEDIDTGLAENAEYCRGYNDGYDDALVTMEFARPPKNRPDKKRRQKEGHKGT